MREYNNNTTANAACYIRLTCGTQYSVKKSFCRLIYVHFEANDNFRHFRHLRPSKMSNIHFRRRIPTRRENPCRLPSQPITYNHLCKAYSNDETWKQLMVLISNDWNDSSLNPLMRIFLFSNGVDICCVPR